jgi:hypothetical protein
MVLQIAIGTLLMLLSIVAAALAFWVLEKVLARSGPWFRREPHRPKLFVVLLVTVVWILGMVTIGVWIWALAFWAMGIFITLEASVYFALVAFTTLGFGDILLPQEWRLLGGMAAANGLLNMGLFTAMMVEILRFVRVSQLESRRR